MCKTDSTISSENSISFSKTSKMTFSIYSIDSPLMSLTPMVKHPSKLNASYPLPEIKAGAKPASIIFL